MVRSAITTSAILDGVLALRRRVRKRLLLPLRAEIPIDLSADCDELQMQIAREALGERIERRVPTSEVEPQLSAQGQWY